jgi:hypothetical protein
MMNEFSPRDEAHVSEAAPSPTPPPAPIAAAHRTPRDVCAWAWLVLFMAIVTAIRIRLLPTPFERDEGEYAYMGQLLLRGSPPFHDAVNMKLPGTNFMYALMMSVFGQSVVGLHTGLLVVTLVSMLLLFLAFRRIYSAIVGAAVAGVFGMLGVSFVVFGFAGHATHFVVLFVAAALLVLSYDIEKPSIRGALGAGLLLGAAVMMKQHAVFFVLFGGAVIAGARYAAGLHRWRVLAGLCVFGAGVAVPYLLLVVWMAVTGDLKTFWFWTVTYAVNYGGEATPQEAWQRFSEAMAYQPHEYPVVWGGAVAGLVAVSFSRYSRLKKLLAVGFALMAFATVLPGSYYRNHYFVTLLPAVGLLFALAMEVAAESLVRRRPAVPWRGLMPTVLLVSAVCALVAYRGYYVDSTPPQIVRFVYRDHPFVESIGIAEFIRKNTKPTDTIAIFGSEPQIAFYADRRLAMRQIYTYPMSEDHPYKMQLQEESIREVESAKPRYIVDFRYCAGSLTSVKHPPYRFVEWSIDYLARDYAVVAAGDMKAGVPTQFVLGEEAERHTPVKNSIFIFVRK